MYLLIINPGQKDKQDEQERTSGVGTVGREKHQIEKDVCNFSATLKKITVEAALNAELDENDCLQEGISKKDIGL